MRGRYSVLCNGLIQENLKEDSPWSARPNPKRNCERLAASQTAVVFFHSASSLSSQTAGIIVLDLIDSIVAIGADFGVLSNSLFIRLTLSIGIRAWIWSASTATRRSRVGKRVR
jgi:hypothetical protein